MKAIELRIGNYVSVILDIENAISEVECVMIDSIDINTCRVSSISERLMSFDRHNCNLKEMIQPIPLTEEWLLKFGFNGECESFHMEGITIEEVSDGGKWVVYMFDEYHAVECSLAIVQHVHQLQNLYFALTNEELTL